MQNGVRGQPILPAAPSRPMKKILFGILSTGAYWPHKMSRRLLVSQPRLLRLLRLRLLLIL